MICQTKQEKARKTSQYFSKSFYSIALIEEFKHFFNKRMDLNIRLEKEENLLIRIEVERKPEFFHGQVNLGVQEDEAHHRHEA